MHIVPGTNYDKEGFEYSVSLIERVAHRKTPTSLGSKDGLDLFYIKDNYDHYVYLKDGKEYIGMIRLANEKYHRMGYRVGAVYVCAKYRGQGLGTVLYLGAINRLKKIHSSTNIGEQAVRTWRSIAKYHKLEIFDQYEDKVKYTWGKRSKAPVIEGHGRMDVGYESFNMVASA